MTNTLDKAPHRGIGNQNVKGKGSPRQQGSNIPQGWKASYSNPLPPIRCTGTIRNGERKGEQCGKWSLKGSTVCDRHGGSLPSVQEAAAKRIEEARKQLMGMAPTAAEVINDIMLSGDNDAVRLKAAQDILDRTGILKGQEVTMDVRTEDTAAKEIEQRLAQMRKSLLGGNDIASIEEVAEEPALDNDTEDVLELEDEAQ